MGLSLSSHTQSPLTYVVCTGVYQVKGSVFPQERLQSGGQGFGGERRHVEGGVEGRFKGGHCDVFAVAGTVDCSDTFITFHPSVVTACSTVAARSAGGVSNNVVRWTFKVFDLMLEW